MFKKVFALVLTIAFVLTATACGVPKKQSTGSAGTVIPASEQTPTPSPSPSAPPKNTVSIGDKIVTDNWEVTITNVEFSHEVHSAATGDFLLGFSTLTPNDDEVFIHAVTQAKNLQKETCYDEPFDIKADYNNGYKYTGYTYIDDPNSGFDTDFYMEPLTTENVHFFVRCPLEVEETDYPLQVIFTVDGTDYTYTMR